VADPLEHDAQADPLEHDAQADPLEHESQPDHIHVVVVVTELDAPTQRALQFAEAFRPRSLVALNVCTDLTQTTGLIKQWASRRMDIPLKSVYPMDDDTDPVLHYVDRVRREHPAGVVMVVLPVVAVTGWWQRQLHRLPDPTLARRLSRMDRVMIAEVPWQLGL
jgi:hypothetical protein